MKKKIVWLGIVLTMAINLCGCGKKSDSVELIMADVQEGEHPTALAVDKFAELVKKRTDGRVVIEVYHGDSLGSEQEQLQQITVGGIDFVRASVSTICDYADDLQALQALYLYDSDEQMWKVLNGEIGQGLLTNADLAEANMVGLTWFSGGSRNFYTSGKAITSPSDLQGLTIRVNTPSMNAFLKEVGAEAKSIDYADILSALNSGVIDGAENNWPSYISTEHYTAAPYITVDEHTRVPEMIVASKSAMEALSEEDQEIIRECAAEAQAFQIKKMQEYEAEVIEVAEKAGCTITYINDEQLKAFQEVGEKVNEKVSKNYMSIIRKIKEVQ